MHRESPEPRRVVYTAVFGNYENILEQPVAKDSDIQFICFTDDPKATSETWDIHLLTDHLQDDPTRSARQIKILGHERLSQFDESMWIDNRVLLKKDPSFFFEDWLGSHDMALPKHSYRDSVGDEFRIILNSGFDDPYKVREQLSAYKRLAPEVLEIPVYWTAILLRRQNEITSHTMRVWMDNVLRYSKRDQLSINYAILHSALTPNMIDVDNFESQWHRWISTSELPKNRKVRYWQNHGFKYPFWLRVSDTIRSNRIIRRVASKGGFGDVKWTHKISTRA